MIDALQKSMKIGVVRFIVFSITVVKLLMLESRIVAFIREISYVG